MLWPKKQFVKAMPYTTILGGNMDWGPIIGMFIAVGGMMLAFVIGYLHGYSDAKEGK